MKGKYMPNAELYNAMGNAKRLAILNTIGSQDMSASALAKALKISNANLSQHIRILKHVRLVQVHRKGLEAYYRLADPRVLGACTILHTFSKTHRRS